MRSINFPWSSTDAVEFDSCESEGPPLFRIIPTVIVSAYAGADGLALAGGVGVGVELHAVASTSTVAPMIASRRPTPTRDLC
jgi:hypothetical protein